ncbi:MAG: hypothetical protein RMJ43_04500 [Chloroherpetonaceae bacterium]|nr:hypothetical protein [Chthonomonadaceae bacterium]MDW8207073.1 hypothetical protein [Chloroherpetonaceae bacterium]
MSEPERAYEWYCIGCQRLAQEPVNREQFLALWREYEAFAEQLKAAEASGTVQDIDPVQRERMRLRAKHDPFLRAILVGMVETGSVSEITG